ncbi:MAG: ABC transporter ATP-binding protein [Clostridiales Family XIII bacterium]|jgi:ABC-2 type transport system ATP-binding protein|nr:ABC transporter ATP-binding protein [Clostridiales Family XIII bacterium]
MIEIEQLVKKYGNHTAVDELSLTIEPGRVYGFLGPNGAGKSTTMNLITGYLGATRGTVKIDGYDIFKAPEKAKRLIGYLPETPPLYADMTVGEYLDFVANLKLNAGQKKRQYIEESIEMTRIADVRGRLIRSLSKGYRQRVGLAQAILGYPKIIILDEPTIGLDPAQIIEIRELIRSLEQGHTVILSSHILSEVREVCDHIFIMSHGRLVANDTTEQLMRGARQSDQTLRLIVRGDGTTAATILSTVPGVDAAGIALSAGEEEGTTVVAVPVDGTRDIRNDVIVKLVRKKCEILEIGSARRSLEDIFLDLIASDEAAEAPQDESTKTSPHEASETLSHEASDGDPETSPHESPDADSEGVSHESEEGGTPS